MGNEIDYKEARLITIEYYRYGQRLSEHFTDMFIVSMKKPLDNLIKLIEEKARNKVQIMIEEGAITDDDLISPRVRYSDYFLPDDWDKLHLHSLSTLL